MIFQKAVLSFLEENKMKQTYLLLLSLARGKHDIEELHGLLRANCRLDREELSLLKRAWNNLYSGNPPQGGIRPSNETCREMFEKCCPEKGLTKHYFKKLIENSISRERNHQYGNLYASHVPVYFFKLTFFREFISLKLFDQKFKVQFDILDDELVIQLIISQEKLTEKVTHQLISEIPDYFWDHYKMTSSNTFLKFIYSVKLSEHNKLKNIIRREKGEVKKDIYLVSGHWEFVYFLQNVLKEIGLPITEILFSFPDTYTFVKKCILELGPKNNMELPGGKILECKQLGAVDGEHEIDIYAPKYEIPTKKLKECIRSLVDDGKSIVIASGNDEDYEELRWTLLDKISD